MSSLVSSPRVAVLVGGERLIVPGERILQHRPRGPRGREAALGAAGGDDLLGELSDLRPGRRRLLGVEPRLLEGILVVVEDRARGVERHRVELAVLGVVAGHRLDEVPPVDGDLLVLHQLGDGIDGARQQHRLGAHVEDLDDVRRVLLAVGRDGAREDLGVRPLVERLHFVLGLALVELLHQLLHGLAELSAHGVPEMDLRGGEGGNRSGQDSETRAATRARPSATESTHEVLRGRCGDGTRGL